MTKIALFGTSADPPTAGHQSILGWLSNHYDKVAVWASDNPFKNHQTSLGHRMTMLQLLIDDIKPTPDNIYLCDLLSHKRSLISVAKAKEIWGKDNDYTLVIGSDLIGQIRRWYHVDELLKEVRILVVPRPGYAIYESDLKALEEMGGNCSVADLDAPEVSSTAYRENRNQNVLTPPIQNYIYQEQLYI